MAITADRSLLCEKCGSGVRNLECVEGVIVNLVAQII